MAGVNFQPMLARELRACSNALPLALRFGSAMLGQRIAPGAGMDLNDGRAEGRRGLDLSRLGGNEQRHANSRPLELGNGGRELNLLPSSIKPAFGGALLPAFRDEASSMWPGRHRDANHFVGCSHFQIERLCNLGLEPRDVVVPDVPAILPQMCGDAVSTGFNRDLRCMDGVGVPPPPPGGPG